MLSALEFVSLYNTCERFRSIAVRAFSSVHKEVNLKGWDVIGWMDGDLVPEAKGRLKCLFRVFGKEIIHLKFDISHGYRPMRQLIDLIVSYCSGTLKSLHVNYQYRIERVKAFLLISQLRPILVSLDSFALSGSHTDAEDLFADFSNLVDFNIISSPEEYERQNLYYRFQPFENMQPQLQYLQLCGRSLDLIPFVDMKRLFRSQTKLREVSLSQNCFCKKEREVFRAIALSGSANLISLKLNNFTIDKTIIPDARVVFGKLKSLTLIECALEARRSDGLFSECEKLQSLTYDFESLPKLLRNDFPQLKLKYSPGATSLLTRGLTDIVFGFSIVRKSLNTEAT